jgi:hypothetical protein
VNVIVQLTALLDAHLLPLVHTDKRGSSPLSADLVHAHFLQAVVWSFGACLKQEDRTALDSYIKYLSGLSTAPTGARATSSQLPNEKPLISDHQFQSELAEWLKYDDLIPKYEHDRSKRFTELLVPTVDTIRLGRNPRLKASIDFFLRMVTPIDVNHPSACAVRRRHWFE